MNETRTNKSRDLLLTLLIIAVMSGVVYYNRANYVKGYEVLLVKIGINGPCKQPIEYSIGSFDKSFNISQERFLAITKQAAGLWEEALNKDLFKYSNTGKLKINLIYDNRQKATTDMQSISNNIDSNKESYDMVKAQYLSLKAQYDQGRGSMSVRDFNVIVDRLNNTARHLNSLASDINKNVKTYNNIGASTGLEFEEGEYVSDDSGERINIYQYTDYDKLLRVLSHEFGHSLGVDHVNDPKAIMYPLNNDQSTTLAPDDIAALKTVCGIN